MNERINALRSFLDASHSMYHAQNYLVETLKAEGYTRLPENETVRQGSAQGCGQYRRQHQRNNHTPHMVDLRMRSSSR